MNRKNHPVKSCENHRKLQWKKGLTDGGLCFSLLKKFIFTGTIA